MTWTLTPLAAVQLAGVASALALATYAYRRRTRPGVIWVAVMLLGDAVWMLTAAINYATTSLAVSRAMLQLRYLGIAVVPIALLFFALEYTGRENWLTNRRKVLLAMPAAGALVLALTDGVHGLFYASIAPAANPQGVGYEYGLAAVPWIAYAFVLAVAATLVFVHYGLVSEHVYRWQAYGLAGAVLFTIIADFLYFLPVPPNEFAITPLSILIASLVMVGIIYRHELLRLVPATRELGRRELVDGMDLGMIVVDPEGRIADVNPAGARPLGRSPAEVIGTSVATLLPDVAAAEGGSRIERTFEVDGVGRDYEIRTDDVGGASGVHLVTLQDVSARNRQQRRIDVLQRVLRHNVRTDMQLVISRATTIEKETEDPELADAATGIADVASGVVTVSDVIRTLERNLDDTEAPTQDVDACAVIETTLASFARSWPEADLDLRCRTDAAVVAGVAFQAVVESLVENALEHNDAPAPAVDVRVGPDPDDPDEWVRIAVADNGPGIPASERRIVTGSGEITPLQHGSGLGLWQAVWLVEAWGGAVDIADNDPRGSVVTVRLRRA